MNVCEWMNMYEWMNDGSVRSFWVLRVNKEPFLILPLENWPLCFSFFFWFLCYDDTKLLILILIRFMRFTLGETCCFHHACRWKHADSDCSVKGFPVERNNQIKLDETDPVMQEETNVLCLWSRENKHSSHCFQIVHFLLLRMYFLDLHVTGLWLVITVRFPQSLL